LTRTCQGFTSARLVAALELCWSAIRTRHPQVPAAVVVIGPGSTSKPNDALKLGHFAALRWQHGPDRLPEVLVSGEGLARTPEEVFTTLVHEAAHGLADARSIQDTSRQGRWHNARFAALADELGLIPAKDDRLGWSPCRLPQSTRDTYAAVIDELAAAMGAYRHPDEPLQRTRASNNNGHSLTCACPRRIRVSHTTAEEGPIVCGRCHATFTTEPGPPSASDLPVYGYGQAPAELATRTQLSLAGLRPGPQPPAARLVWRHGLRAAALYRIDLAAPKRPTTPAQRAATERAMTLRRTCGLCGQIRPYCISRRTRLCLTCAGGAR
jgi:hypothetical protein